jgi:two-component system sensor histidine kinase YesM
MTVIIICLGDWFAKRMDAFSHVMHRAAAGDFTVEDPNINKAEDEIWELNQDLHVMINDIQKLMDTAMQERIQKEQLYSRQKDVELKMLAAQINPHFLYNTLENIRMMASMNHERDIADIAQALTKYLRSVLNVSGELKSLAWEMDMVESYIKIQNYRFGDRITAQVYYPEEMAKEIMIIPFIIQPFVENAYVHAMEDMEADGRIWIRVEVEDSLYLYIEDNGHGMSEEKLQEVTRDLNDFENLDRTHIGICNVNQRIKLKFGEPYGVDFESVENQGTKVKIRMPLILNE